jgi:CheY-like chemotaxis protein
MAAIEAGGGQFIMSKNIVWIDDEYATIGLLVKPLHQAGYGLKRCRTYGEVMDNLEEVRQADLLIVDLIIPPGRANVEGRYLGLELMKALRAEGINTPIIVMSVVLRNSVRIEVEKIPGIVGFVNKTSPEPIEEELLDMVRRTLGA